MSVRLNENELIDAFKSLGASEQMLETYYPRINEPLVKPSDLDFGSREFFYWTHNRVIDIPKAEKGQSRWTRLNLIQVVWIKVVRELRSFNFPFNHIVKIKEDLFQNAFQLIFSLIETDLDEIVNSIKDTKAQKLLRQVFLLSKENQKIFDEHLVASSTIISGLLSDILLFNRKIYLHLCSIGDEILMVIEGHTMQHASEANLIEIRKRTHLTISLNDLISEHLFDIKYEKMNKEFGLISEDELVVLESIRKKEVREIHITKDDNEKLSYTTTSRSELKDDQVQMIKRILRMNEYDDVRVILRNEKHIYLENKKRRKAGPGNTAQ